MAGDAGSSINRPAMPAEPMIMASRGQGKFRRLGVAPRPAWSLRGRRDGHE